MLVSKQNRKVIYEALFKGKDRTTAKKKEKRKERDSWNATLEMLTHFWFILDGALVAPKDYNAPKHVDLDVPNLEVIKVMQSLTSKGLVKTQFSWQWYYYTLTDEGIDYLRECKF